MKFSNNCEVKLKPLMSSRSENTDSCRHIALNCICSTATLRTISIVVSSHSFHVASFNK